MPITNFHFAKLPDMDEIGTILQLQEFISFQR